MGKYRRFVAYVYEYMDETKGNNRGFVRVEARNGNCSMDFQLSGIDLEGELCEISGFVREGKGTRLVPLAVCMMQGDVFRYRIETNAVHMGSSQFSLEDLDGLVLRGPKHVYGTCWNGEEVPRPVLRPYVEEIKEEHKEKAEEMPAENVSLEAGAEGEAGPEIPQQNASEPKNSMLEISIPQLQKSELQESEELEPEETEPEEPELEEPEPEELEPEPEEPEPEEPEPELPEPEPESEEPEPELPEPEPELPEPESVLPEQKMPESERPEPELPTFQIPEDPEQERFSPKIVAPEMPEQRISIKSGMQQAISQLEKMEFSERQQEEPLQRESQNIEEPPQYSARREHWTYMQSQFPHMEPFPDGGIVECIKITPSDMTYLQEQDWMLGNNNFLLHGYYSYRHLMLGRIEGEDEYVLGIPGIYDHQERFMANMFGFTHFKPAEPARMQMGQFGYWYRRIH
ncbi:MAG: DUF6128 domain-containing protein [Lachnospiraceae bacterium]|nr:DUF6128 domain-containing protein [Lachnospiraceae bacterium]